ncbi:MAG TPA: hypothetical protein VMW63_00610 [Methanoregulaceae archaeon]|nr:hypothetical protein [Methanoregulaceae archaeon]
MNGKILIPAIIVLTVFIAALGGCITQPSDEKSVSGTGTVVYQNLEGGFYGIVADDESHYYPLNLEEQYQVDGLPIVFSGIIRDDVATIVQWGIPLELISVQTLDQTAGTGDVNITMDESRQIAEAYVKNMTEYTQYNGKNLRLAQTITLRCPYCWQFVYEFDMQSMKDPDVIDHIIVSVTVQEGKVAEVFSSEGLPVGILTVAELLNNPVYDTEITITGRVSLLGMLNCPCFNLTSGDKSIEVWYGLMVTDEGTELPPVSVEGIENGDHVLVTGELKHAGTHNLEGAFWASDIGKV